MGRIRVAVEKLDRAFGCRAHDRVVNAFAGGDGAHRLRTVGDALGHRQHVRRHAEALRGERLTRAAVAGDHFVEYQQDPVLVADFAQPLQVTLRRHQAAGRAGDRFDEARGDVLGTVEIDEAHQVLGEFGAMRAFALGEEVLLEVRMPHMGDAGQPRPELAAVVDQPRQRHATEIDTVISALTRNEYVAATLSTRLVIGERDLHRRIHRLRARVGEKDPIEITGCELGYARRELELLGMRAQKRRAKIKFAQLLADGVGDLLAAVPGGNTKQARGRVDNFVAAVIP